MDSPYRAACMYALMDTHRHTGNMEAGLLCVHLNPLNIPFSTAVIEISLEGLRSSVHLTHV